MTVPEGARQGRPRHGEQLVATAVAREPARAESEDAAPATATASASARALPAPQAAARPLATPAFPPAPPPAGDGSRSEPRARPEWRTRRHRGLSRLHIGRHVATADELDRLQLTGRAVGLPLGRDQAGAPVPLPLFGPRPSLAVLLGGLWAARLVVFRSLGFGARAVVFTGRYAAWRHLGQWATGRTDRVAVLPPGSPLGTVASADTPLLRVDDLDDAGEAVPSPAGEPPWQTRLLVCGRLTPARLPAVRAADVLLTQRLTPEEAAAVVRARGLADRGAHALQLLQDDMLALDAGTGIRYAWTEPDGAEQRALGRPGAR
ncbi:hypothetical protein [Prauserella flavalba]|uniref:Uncharacterized protein n=1 Tax=Prauserella flavalba TaxID=1477506 RepID=A0A318LSN4_9PSEU|nr:hypothetical protein [Prauserella flavalba]PXY36620.1 hypothetical protein BA062_14715 [Prauserella flavalba]